MTVIVDGDSFPAAAVDRAVERASKKNLDVLVVSDRPITRLETTDAECIVVEHGSGRTDAMILKRARAGDLILTQDLPLALELTESGAVVMNGRGDVRNGSEIRKRIQDSQLMKAMRAGGITNRTGRNYSSEDRDAFVSSLDRLLSDIGQ